MSRHLRLPLAAFGALVVIAHVLLAVAGPQYRVCVSDACAGVVVSMDAPCCPSCDQMVAADLVATVEPPCSCYWMPVPETGFMPYITVHLPVPEVLRSAQESRLPSSAIVRLRPGTFASVPPPHLRALRCVILTC